MPRDDVTADMLVLCGPLCAGKTTVANEVSVHTGLPVVTGQSAIEFKTGSSDLDRIRLQEAGTELEQATAGAWLASAVDAIIGIGRGAVVDAARSIEQLRALRGRRGVATVVIQVTASDNIRRSRYERRNSSRDRGISFDDVAFSPLEREAGHLAALADLAVDTSGLSAEQAAARVLAGFHRRNRPLPDRSSR